jgi:putative cardiolipin synthase
MAGADGNHRRHRFLACLAATVLAAGCASLPPGAGHPREPSKAFDRTLATRLGQEVAVQVKAHPGMSGARLFPRGPDGLLLRTQLIRAAQRSLDIQYYIFVEDDTGKVLLASLLDAAERGVRVRVLIDDLNLAGRPGTRQTLAALDNHRNIEVRLFNPLNYRGDTPVVHQLDLMINAPRVNHRMHNKLFIADGAVALVGGRNVADEYFEIGSPPVRFGDFDVAVVGPVVPGLAQSFDAFWNSPLSVPQEAVGTTHASAESTRPSLGDGNAAADLRDLARRIESGEPLNGLLSGRVGFAWGPMTVVADPPEKATAGGGAAFISPTEAAIISRAKDVTREVVIISPYFVPGPAGLQALQGLRERGARVRVLTNSLASTDVPMVHSAYRRYRVPLLDAGVEMYEVRPIPGQSRADKGSLGSVKSGAPFALHAKAYVFDRRTVFLGSANLDPRSLTLNTEVGLLIESPGLARQIIERFDQFSESANSYQLTSDGKSLHWRTSVDGKQVEWTDEPDTTPRQRMSVELMSLLPEGQL